MKICHFVSLFVGLFCCFSVVADKQIHQHKALEIPAGVPIPGIAMNVARDPIDGINVLLSIENYLMNSPLDPREDSVVLQGHAHVFVNGVKKQRLYGNALHIPADWLKKGVNQVAVSLNSHEHENWTIDGKSIVGSVFVDLAQDKLVLHHFTSQPINTEHHHH